MKVQHHKKSTDLPVGEDTSMTRAKELRDILPPGIEVRPGIYHHPKSPLASVERLRQLIGVIALTAPAPSGKFLDDDDDEPRER